MGGARSGHRRPDPGGVGEPAFSGRHSCQRTCRKGVGKVKPNLNQAPDRSPRPHMAEAGLITAARMKDEAAIRELVRRLNPRLFRIARGIVASDAEAEEVVQETYLSAFAGLERFDGRAQFSTWITRIAINAALMRTRRARPEEEYDTVAEENNSNILKFVGVSETPETNYGRMQVSAILEVAVADLSPALRLPFVLHEMEGMNIRDIARDLSLNPITVKTRLFRARRQLRAVLEQKLKGGFGSVFPFDGARCAHMADTVIAALRANGKL
ncbi:RNA polymerase sigma factor [Hoeflea sp. YIM 152468]|uniref:RNA polymerase sigma factor n=1 Tax=Hoeflea sp. YIM 152468 TaxID=3031759 RepID=UPI0023D9FA1C|nr:RNA polymerase sigma factor [Hoeflea sp. YIM 152468]MDF1609932.1 RNA polymerase sigma factor [Hoeflea sp. YIM 152468]